MLSAEIINALQTIASRENNPLDPVVVTIGSIHGGTKHNIIPDEVKMQLNGPFAPMRIVPLQGNNFTFLVLPVRLKGE